MKKHKTKVGVLGGLFDPIHIGHLSLARHAREQLDLISVLFIPTYYPPHRNQGTPFQHRCAMIALAIEGQPEFELCEIEKELSGPSYTINTLMRLAKQYPDSELYFIIGADNLAKMEEWHHPEKIFATAHVVVGQRPGAKPAACRFEQQMLKINIPPLDISSTQIRNLARAGRPIADLVPPAVAEYIARERLYV